MRGKLFLAITFGGSLVAVQAAAADAADEGPSSPNAELAPADRAASAGLLLPLTVAPRLSAGTSYALLRAGYDGAAHGATLRGAAEAGLLRSLSLRVEFEQGAEVPYATADDRVRIGARLSLLEQDRDGLDAGVALFYDPRDFRSEGNVIFGLLAGRQFGRVGLFGNALVGSDPEGDDQTLELRLSSFYRAAEGLQIGIDNRARHNFSTDDKRDGSITANWDLEALPTLSWALGRFVLVADAGVRALQTTGPFGMPAQRTRMNVGLLTLAGVGGVF
jgi:hypothetical protein